MASTRRFLVAAFCVVSLGLAEGGSHLLFAAHPLLQKLVLGVAQVVIVLVALSWYERYIPDIGSSRLSITNVSAPGKSETKQELL
jgi:hypothetical protein